MYRNKKILCIIPARAGSIGLANKNIKQLAGKPLIAWTIEQALESKYLDKIIVSTDSRKIARVAGKYKAEVPFIRPKKLATSSAKMFDVIEHAVKYFRKRGDNFDLVILLQLTSPLRTSKDIDSSISLLFAKKAKTLVSVCLSEHHPLWANTLTGEGFMDNFIKSKKFNRNRQELPVFYRPNGAIYLAFTKDLLKNKGFIGSKTIAYIMPAERSVDIDTKLDFDFVALLMKRKR